ncbi:MAG TPA: ATP-dependent Clp protease ATP-binding subunit, partial [Candidatus Polarisedimenticolia bacterium]|nr:ATP-dependent Clp protease ATP-binding subunit [Candidatus Polarisedimenticolia bacterium]
EGQLILEVDKGDIEDVISRWTGIPLATVEKEEMEKLLRMEEFLHERIVGQHSAISALARAIRRSRAGLKSPMRPMGSFIFLGPTGVGKTEVARTLAAFLFGNETALVRFDMSEYMEKHAIAKMIGSPPGYVGHEEGGQLTERIKRKPYSVILLDEIEKAHPDVLNILLQVFEDGQLTDAYGDVVDFKNTLVIMTSNIGSSSIDKDKQPGFLTKEEPKEATRHREMVMADVKRTLSPEFLNRIDEIIVFDPLDDSDLLQIAGLMIRRLNETLKGRNLEISLTDEAYQWLLKATSSERSYGARPLRRAIQRYIEDALSEDLIQGKFPGCGHLEVFQEGDKLAFREAPQFDLAT